MKNKKLNNKLKITKKYVFRKSKEVRGKSIKGYDFKKGIDYEKILDSYETIGFQATNLAKAINIIKEMRKNNSYIYLGYTSNLVSSGLRDIICYLTKNKMIDVLVTTAGGIEEDFIKCLGDFKLGDFKVSGKELRKKGINRIGNIFAPNNRYVEFEKFIQPILKEIYDEQKRKKQIITPLDLIWKVGEKINDEKSIYYNAWKNKIPVYCPAILDGAIGDNIYFFSLNHKDFKIDIVKDLEWFNNTTIGKKKTGAIILGAGIIKHAILNANMLRNGLDYAVYINTEQEYDGSDSGASTEEAVSWGKIKGKRIKVFADATLVFPLIVAKCFRN
ncbi:MAG: deoxyhypusine synthase [Candidatus Pacearchaeota archaeon]